MGYADEADPISVKIFPRDFEAKERVLDHIDAYNKQVKAAGHDEQAISYTDYMGIIMGSVTDIVNTISLVLIAFVSISLVVSSIMIGIITYISVLERKKEIGILRAIGASKRNVANVFNAETSSKASLLRLRHRRRGAREFSGQCLGACGQTGPQSDEPARAGCAGAHRDFGVADGCRWPAAGPQRIQERPRGGPTFRIM